MDGRVFRPWSGWRICSVIFFAGVVSAGTKAQTPVVSIKKLPDLADGVQSFPRVMANAAVPPEIAAKINMSLARFDAQTRKESRDCRKNGTDADWSRDVQTTMRGPGYVSFLANETYDCGGAHPEDMETALVYDLRTGLPVNWETLLPSEAKGEVYRSPGQLSIGVVHWPAMLKRAKQQAVDADGGSGADCEHAYDSAQLVSFNVYLSGADHALALSPNLMSHYDRAMCSAVVLIKAEEAKRLGVALSLVEALMRAR